MVLRFGKHKGRRLADVPASYLAWLMREAGMAPDIRAAAQAELRRRQAPDFADDLPRAEPRVVLGVALDEIQAGRFAQAVQADELAITPDLPLSSPLPGLWRRWCEVNRMPFRVRVVTLEELLICPSSP